MSLLNHTYTSNSHDFNTHKNQAKIHPTILQATYNARLHESSTLSKFHNTKQFNNSKYAQKKKIIKDPHDRTMISNQIIQCLKLPQNKQKQNDNVPP